MPVLPAVPSTTVPPGRSLPLRSASSMIARAARSFTEPPGFMNSALPRISQPVELAEMVQPDQRCVADCVGEAVADAHAVSLTCFDTGLRCGGVEPPQRFVQARHFAHDQQSRRLNACLPRLLSQVRERAGHDALLGARALLDDRRCARLAAHRARADAKRSARGDRGPCRTRRSAPVARADPNRARRRPRPW